MLKYVLKRILRSGLTLFLIITIVFSLLRLMPVEGYFTNFEKLTETQIKIGLAKQYLDQSLPVQLGFFYRSILKGDFGLSNKYRTNYPVVKIIAEKAPLSLKMGLLAIALALLAGLPLGILMAHSSAGRLKVWDKIGTVFVVLIQAIPAAIYHLFVLIYGTEWLGPILRIPTLFREDNWLTWLLPVFSLSLGNTAYFALWLRRYMIDESTKDYITLARAKGLPSRKIFSRHIFRNAFVPLVQYIPTSILLTLVGSLYVETLYSIPGMGGLLVSVIKLQDNTMVQALVLLYSGISILGLLIGDIIMAALDPRISFTAKERV
ncbi:MAG: ABC transporter permease [Spirochaetaceae bacterium]|jgi:ABC-type dipeptide/oligopeptide/nickel transport system permease component|nr:ABC transporter permease [Spirochaetaceae bacterium]